MDTIDLKGVQARLQSILLMGMEGAGKTRFIGTCPKPILLYSFDGGYRTLAGMPGIRCKVFFDKDRRTPKAADEFEKDFSVYLNGKEPPYDWGDGRVEPFKTIAIDPISSWSLYTLHHIQYINRTVDKKPTWDEYAVLKNRGIDMINRCLQVVEERKELLVVTAHISSEKDEETGQLWFWPDMEGKATKEVLGRYFDLVGVLKTDKRPDGTVSYQLCTVGERRERARLRLPATLDGVIKAVDVPDYGVLHARLAAALEKR